jgi:hypothetical protein
VECLDIEAAFLEGDIDKPIYIEFPEGMDELGFVTRDEMYTIVYEAAHERTQMTPDNFLSR